MTDYLNERPKLKVEPERQQAVTEKRCKSCANYTFYHCNVTNGFTAPDAICDCAGRYQTKPCYV